MATQKVTLSKLNLKKNTNFIPLELGEQTILIKAYLPIQEKLDLITRIVNQSLDDNNFANPARVKIFTVLEVIYAYTNISFSDKQKEDFLGLYDIIVSSGFWEKFYEVLKETNEYEFITKTTHDVIDEVYKYKNSALGILQAITEDYSNLNLDATKIKEKVTTKEGIELVSKVIKELG